MPPGVPDEVERLRAEVARLLQELERHRNETQRFQDEAREDSKVHNEMLLEMLDLLRGPLKRPEDGLVSRQGAIEREMAELKRVRTQDGQVQERVVERRWRWYEIVFAAIMPLVVAGLATFGASLVRGNDVAQIRDAVQQLRVQVEQQAVPPDRRHR